LPGAVGLVAILACLAPTGVRDVFGEVLVIQLVGLVPAVVLAVRGRPLAFCVVGMLHLVYSGVLLGADPSAEPAALVTRVVVVQGAGLAGCVFSAVRLRRARTRQPPKRTDPPAYGLRGHEWKQLGCGAQLVALFVAALVAGPPTAMITGAVIGAISPLSSSVETIVIVASVATTGAMFWFLTWLIRRVTRRPAFWCEHCGVRTRPQFRVCASCGRVKALREA
jgi:hypothetical protein